MNWTSIALLSAIFLVEFIIVELFGKKYIASYMNEKGQNLAKKEDIEEITKRTETVLHEYKKAFEDYANDKRFKYEYCYKQFSELYVPLFTMCQQSFVSQSGLLEGESANHDFIEIQYATHHGSTTVHVSYDTLCDTVIQLGALATKRLLMCAIKCQFLLSTSARAPETKDEKNALISYIIEDFNELRNKLLM